MRNKLIPMFIAVAFAAFLATTASAEDKTFKGEGACAKCSLKETKECQNSVKVKEGDKTVTYLIEHNDVSKAFHGKICTAPAKIVVTGTVKDVAGKKVIVPTKIELDKA